MNRRNFILIFGGLTAAIGVLPAIPKLSSVEQPKAAKGLVASIKEANEITYTTISPARDISDEIIRIYNETGNLLYKYYNDDQKGA